MSQFERHQTAERERRTRDAAPKLLAACQLCLVPYEGLPAEKFTLEVAEWLTFMRAAVADATGETA